MLCLLNISFLQMLPKIRIRIAIKVGSVPTVQHIECTDPKHYANDKDFWRQTRIHGWTSYHRIMMKKGITLQMLKGQSNEIFDPQFFSSFKLVWATDQRDKIFSNFVSFSLRYSQVSIEKTDSAQYHTALSQKKIHPRTFLQNWKLSPFFSII